MAHIMEDGVVHLLSKYSHNVYTPTITGLGEQRHLATRDTGLDTHIIDIIQALEYEDLNEIIQLVIVMGDNKLSAV